MLNSHFQVFNTLSIISQNFNVPLEFLEYMLSDNEPQENDIAVSSQGDTLGNVIVVGRNKYAYYNLMKIPKKIKK